MPPKDRKNKINKKYRDRGIFRRFLQKKEGFLSTDSEITQLTAN
ncbi:hypothetical protein ADIS_2353 [Lunatimonas lonarensis]|uniref:Uncharacterized protein n=1 Tax=Lunatimonas lonarensis TaxID=1232681 RepID=R7ZSY5_9BACT|nr:hypothetical protein ADIS_2353 [Lunatimonas lonarensis]